MVGATPAAAAVIVNGCCTLMATNPTANASLVLEDGVEGLELVMCGVLGQVLKVPIKFIVCHHLLQHTRPNNC
jgi:hypothetical protein